MKIEDAKKISDCFICDTYGPRRLVLEKGEKSVVYDTSGKEYLDFLSGIAVSSLGHNNKKIVKAVSEQAKKLIHTSNLYYNVPQLQFAELFGKKVPGYKMFFCNSGAESNEAAIKLTRKYFVESERIEIISFKNSFHGRTMATVTATGQSKYQDAFKPLLPKFNYAEFNDIKSVEKLYNDNTAAVMIELVQCEGGINVATKSFIKALAKFCQKKKILLIIDEVQTGAGRTGKVFCFQHYGIQPDIVTVAKGIAGGIPMGVMLAKKRVADTFTPGDHASTFGGGALTCAAGCEVLKFLSEKNLESIFEKGEYFKEKIKSLNHPLIKEARGLGLILGIALTKEIGNEVQLKCEENGLLVNSIHNKVIRLAPPLIVTKKDINKAIKIIIDILNNY